MVGGRPTTGECSRCEEQCREFAALRAEHEALSAQHEALSAQHEALSAQHEALDAVFQELEGEVESLKAQLRQNSRNSHRPPSSDSPSAPPRTKKKRGKRRRGGQPGHKGSARSLLPTSEVDHVEPCKPERCAGCGAALCGEDPHPERHQVTELPPVRPLVTEYQLHQLGCDRCGCGTRAALPDGVSWSAFGPRVRALVATLSGAWRLPKRDIQQLLADCFGIRMSLGSVSNIEATTSAALEAAVDEARGYVADQSVVHLDETGWREANSKAWLWTAVTELVTVFVLRASRGAKVAREMLTEHHEGIVISDRWAGYSWIPVERRQLCWAHLIRDFRKMAEAEGAAGAVGKELGECARQLFHWWHQVRDGTLKRSSFRTYVSSKLRGKVRGLLQTGTACDHAKVPGMCRAMLKLEPALWTFVRVEGVEPTNNNAERAVRHAVIWRKVCFGTQSRRGSDFVERMLTVVATLRSQERNVLDYVAAACDAAAHRRPAPPLIP